jgi:mannose-6-phosphate isomerase-like protein (cupin superfamily)
MAKAFVLRVPDEAAAISERPRRIVRALCEHPLLDATWSQYEAGERGPDPHVHHQHVDAFYVLEGELEFGVGPDVEPVRAPAGTFVAVPPNVVHTFRNSSGATARWLNFHAPSTASSRTSKASGPASTASTRRLPAAALPPRRPSPAPTPRASSAVRCSSRRWN